MSLAKSRGVGTGGGGGGVPPPLIFLKDQKCHLVMRSALFVQNNVAPNTNLTLKVPFVLPKHIYVCPLTQVTYVLIVS